MYETLIEATREYGAPLYAYDLDRIDGNLSQIRDAFGDEAEVHFACKALTNSYILKYLLAKGCGIDAVSIEEMQISLDCGFKPADINFTPSGASFEEYRFAHEKGIAIHVDNLGALRRLATELEVERVALRINPGVAGGGHRHLQVGADGSKFGLYPEEWDETIDIVKKYGISVNRVHVHVGSDVHTPDEFVKTWRRAFRFAERFASTIEVVDLGGGFGVPYTPDSDSVDMKILGKAARDLAR